MSPTQPFAAEDAFRRYGELYDAVSRTSRLEDLERLRDRVDDLQNDMLAGDPGDDAVRDLFVVMHSELSRKKSQLRQKRGKPPRPDRFANLRENLARLEAETRLLERYVESGTTDAWVESSLESSFAFSVTLVEADHERAEKALAEEGRSASPDEQALLDRAADALEAARSLQSKLT